MAWVAESRYRTSIELMETPVVDPEHKTAHQFMTHHQHVHIMLLFIDISMMLYAQKHPHPHLLLAAFRSFSSSRTLTKPTGGLSSPRSSFQGADGVSTAFAHWWELQAMRCFMFGPEADFVGFEAAKV